MDTRKDRLKQGTEIMLFYRDLYIKGFPGGSVAKKPPANTGDAGSIPWLGRSPGEGNGNLLQ